MTKTKIDESTPKIDLLSILKDTFINKYSFSSLAAILFSLIPFLSGCTDIFYRIICSAVIIMGTILIRSLLMAKYGLNRKITDTNKKALDPRLCGSLDDISALGSTLGAVTGVLSALSDIFIVNGGIFTDNNFHVSLAAATAKAVSLSISVTFITARTSTEASLYITTARAFGKSGGELLRSACRAAHYPDIMNTLRCSCVVRTVAAISFAVVISMLSISGSGAPYTCIGTALLAAATVIIAEMSPKSSTDNHTEEKISLWNRNEKKFCAANIITFVLISFIFLFSFPVQSVYTDYTVTYEFDYNTEYSDQIDIISVPIQNDDNAPLFAGFFVVSIFMLIITAVSINSNDTDIFSGVNSTERLCAILINIFIALGYTIINGFIRPVAAMDTIMWIVAISFGCIIIAVNLIRKLIILKRDERS